MSGYGKKEPNMRDQGQIVLALVIILVGILLFFANVFDVDIGVFCWPVMLILLGVLLLLRPQVVGTRRSGRRVLIGDIRRDGVWEVHDAEFWVGIGDVRLDMREAAIPPGETVIRVLSLVGTTRMQVPAGVGVLVYASGFVTDVRALGRKRESILSPVRVTTEDYETAGQRIRLEVTAFVAEVRVEQIG
jgi:predicted membrane protein